MADTYVNGDTSIDEPVVGSKNGPITIQDDELIQKNDIGVNDEHLNTLKTTVNTDIQSNGTSNNEESVENDTSSDSGINGSYDINDNSEIFHTAEEDEVLASANIETGTIDSSLSSVLKDDDNTLCKIDSEIPCVEATSEKNVNVSTSSDDIELNSETDITVKTNDNVLTASSETNVLNGHENLSDTSSEAKANSENSDIDLSESSIKSLDDVSLTESYVKISLDDESSNDDINTDSTDVPSATSNSISEPTDVNSNSTDSTLDESSMKVTNDLNKDTVSESSAKIDIDSSHNSANTESVVPEASTNVELGNDNISSKEDASIEPVVTIENISEVESSPNDKASEIPVIDLTNSVDVIVVSDDDEILSTSTTQTVELSDNSKTASVDDKSIIPEINVDKSALVENDNSAISELADVKTDTVDSSVSTNPETAPIEAVEDSKSTPEGICNDIKSTLAETVGDATPTAVEIVDNSKTTPVEIIDDSKSTPVEIVDITKTTPVEIIDDSKSTPVEIVDITKTTPVEIIDDSKSTPVEIVDITKTTPVEITDDSKSTPAQVVDDSKATPVEIADDPKSLPAESVDDSKYNPVGTLEDSVPISADSLKEPSPEKISKTEPASSTATKIELAEDDGPAIDEELDILGNGLLKKKIIMKGKGRKTRPLPGNIVTVKCEGRLANGTVVDKHDKLQFILSDEDVIQAFDLAVALMEDQEVATVFTDARYAYGIHGRPDFNPPIPQNASVTYDIEILSVADGPKMEKMSNEEKIIYGDKKRIRGNDLYGKGEYSASINSYKRGIKYLEGTDDEDVMNMKIKCLNNLSAAQLKVKAYKMAIQSLDTVLQFEPENVKALFRKGKCLDGLKKEEEALEYIKKASMLDPHNKTIVQELGRLRSRVAVTHEKEKKIYQKMFNPKKEEKISKEEEDLNWSVKLTSIVVGALGMIAGILWYRHR